MRLRRHAAVAAAAALVVAACDFGLDGLSGGVDEDGGVDATSDALVVPAPPPAADANMDGPIDAREAAAPSFVQGVATSSADASVATATFEGGVASGSAIVVGFDYDMTGGAPLSVNDTQNDTFTTVIDWVGGTGRHHTVSAALGVAGGPTNVTAQITSPTKEIELYVHEYAGVGSVGPSAGANGTTLAVDGMQTPLVTTTAPNTLLFGYGVCGSCVPGTGFTGRSAFHANVTEDRIAATPGAYRGTATMITGSGWSMVVVALAPK